MAETLRLEIVTPQAIVFSEDVHMVTLPGDRRADRRLPAARPADHADRARRDHRHARTAPRPFLAVGEGLVEITADRVVDRDRHGDPGRADRRGQGRGGAASAPRPGCARRSPTRKSRRSTPRWPGRWRNCRSRGVAECDLSQCRSARSRPGHAACGAAVPAAGRGGEPVPRRACRRGDADAVSPGSRGRATSRRRCSSAATRSSG